MQFTPLVALGSMREHTDGAQPSFCRGSRGFVAAPERGRHRPPTVVSAFHNRDLGRQNLLGVSFMRDRGLSRARRAGEHHDVGAESQRGGVEEQSSLRHPVVGDERAEQILEGSFATAGEDSVAHRRREERSERGPFDVRSVVEVKLKRVIRIMGRLDDGMNITNHAVQRSVVPAPGELRRSDDLVEYPLNVGTLVPRDAHRPAPRSQGQLTRRAQISAGNHAERRAGLIDIVLALRCRHERLAAGQRRACEHVAGTDLRSCPLALRSGRTGLVGGWLHGLSSRFVDWCRQRRQ